MCCAEGPVTPPVDYGGVLPGPQDHPVLQALQRGSKGADRCGCVVRGGIAASLTLGREVESSGWTAPRRESAAHTIKLQTKFPVRRRRRCYFLEAVAISYRKVPEEIIKIRNHRAVVTIVRMAS